MKESQTGLYLNTSKEPSCKCHNHRSDHGADSVQENLFQFCTHADVNCFSVIVIIVTVDIPDCQELNFR